MMDSEEGHISVWVCREEKLIFGLSRRTTCADVVRVLLEEQAARGGPSSPPRSCCVLETWRGFQRVLPSRTRILRLWESWAEERSNVKFVLVRSDVSVATGGARSAEARVVLSKHSPRALKEAEVRPAGGISPEKQRRIVRKAFRKLEKMNKKKRAHRDASCAQRMETLAHVVICQDHTIRQQSQRIMELDEEIERFEAKVHVDRMKRHGINYVQDTYLVDAASCSEGDRVCTDESLSRFEEYVAQCEEVVRLQGELWQQEALIDLLAVQVQEETQRRREPAASTAPDSELLLEAERMRIQLDASLYIGLRLSTDLQAIRADLELSQEICEAREKEMRDLLEKVNSLDMEEGTGGEEGCTQGDGEEMTMSTLERKGEWVEQARGLSKAHSVNDDDSDTGLSSLHSQDSDSHPVWESLV